MEKLILFHGTPDKVVVPTYGRAKKSTTTAVVSTLPEA